MYVWTLESEEGPVTLEAGHTHLSPPTLCRIHDGWAAVASLYGMAWYNINILLCIYTIQQGFYV